jgi:hypothetical protein
MRRFENVDVVFAVELDLFFREMHNKSIFF